MKKSLVFLMILLLTGLALAQNGSWWEPANPQPGDTITIFFDPAQNPEMPTNISTLTLHWGVNEIGSGNWQTPPAYLWPPGTVLAPDGVAARTPMAPDSGTVWFVKIPTDSTIFSVHYVFNDGTPQSFGPNWAHSTGGANWNIILETVNPQLYPHVFLLDNRSYFLNYINPPVTFGLIKGTFNGWGGQGADTLKATENPDVLGRRVAIPFNTILQYKYHVNGLGNEDWINDPDNPLTNSGDHNNSVLLFYPDSAGYFYDLQPAHGALLSDGSSVPFQARVQPGATFSGMDPATIQVLLDGSVVSHQFNAGQGLIQGTLTGLSEGNHLLTISGTDSLGLPFKSARIHFGVYPIPPAGILSLDPVGDNTGTGQYVAPSFTQSDATDLREFSLQVTPAHDSLKISIALGAIDHHTRVGVYLLDKLDGFAVDAEENVNLLVRDWVGHGVYLTLADPQAPDFDPASENRLILNPSPFQAGSAVSLSASALGAGRFEFSLSLAELQQVLGSFNHDWYISAYSFLKDGGVTVPVTPIWGGDSTGWNPNVYDALFCDYVLDVPLQERMFNDFNNVHLAMLDAAGRGFLPFSPTDLDPNWTSLPPQVTILTRNAETVLPTKSVRGTVDDPAVTQVVVSRNGNDTTVTVSGGAWNVTLPLAEGDNFIRASATGAGGTGVSGQIVVNRWVDHTPQPAFSFINASGTMVLDASGSTDPDGDITGYHWEMDPENPEPVTLANPDQAQISFPRPTVPGEYYFNLIVTDAENHRGFKRSFLRVSDTGVSAFQTDQSADWLNDAIVYEIFVRSFSPEGNFQGVISKLDYLQDLGINCIWFMPIHESPDDHGYSVADYYSIESDYGTLADFRQLVTEAHARGIRVIIDQVVNHSSINHPFAQDMLDYRQDSPYWNYYEKRLIGDTNGMGYGHFPLSPPYVYTYYSNWSTLPNLNLGYADARKYFIDMAKWWVDSLKIDGYRCDVAWGPINRGYNYWEDWRKALKDLKPEALLIGELSASDHNYAFTNRFDAAYDWSLFHQGYRSIWNNLDLNNLHTLITNYGYWWPPYKFNFRFMENHDEARYIADFGPAKTKLIAALHLTIPGMPLIYAGQEVGETSQRGQIDWSDPNHLLPYYRNLIHARRDYPAFTRGDYKKIGTISFNTVYAISRQYQDNIVLGLFNFKNNAQTGQITLTASQYGLDPNKTYYLNDVITGQVIQTTGSQLGFQTISLQPYQARVFVLADSIVSGLGDDGRQPGAPKTFRLAQNFPNPFNPTTTISFDLPKTVKVSLSVYNILGQRVRTLLDKPLATGSYRVTWDGRNRDGQPVASGIYILHFKAGDFVKNRRMILLK